MSDNDVDNLILRLKQLQVEQAKVIRRLQSAWRNCLTLDVGKFSPSDRVVITTKVNPPVGGEATSGDTVGRVLSITPKRVKIRPDSGIITYRAPQNLVKTGD